MTVFIHPSAQFYYKWYYYGHELTMRLFLLHYMVISPRIMHFHFPLSARPTTRSQLGLVFYWLVPRRNDLSRWIMRSWTLSLFTQPFHKSEDHSPALRWRRWPFVAQKLMPLVVWTLSHMNVVVLVLSHGRPVQLSNSIPSLNRETKPVKRLCKQIEVYSLGGV